MHINIATKNPAAPTPTVTPEQIKFYLEEGYLILEDIVAHDICDRIVSIYESYADKDYAPILNLDREVPEIQEKVMKNRTIVSIVESLVNSEVVGCQTYYLYKKSGTRYASQSWNPHQDNSYPQADPGNYLAVDIALNDQSIESGALYVYPKSHKEGLLPFEPFTGYREEPGVKPGNRSRVPQKYEDKRLDVPLKKGSILVFDGNLIHGSHANTLADRSRPTIITNYAKKGAKFIAGQTAKRMTIPLR